ncbi:hypothetical protein SL054_002435 [Flavobacterium psychrophilum]|uniref:Lipocalin-like domain-containing protein n=1 Tax=Flavobacterium psychrophilum TaxID=96345 RepID=A0A8G2FZ69_FLAPS|nr:hypothetical protein [Flavobacterium psychrophilum]EKT4499987.1 hypothetical protein [Flavobacterium psychrophilum]EKT4550778.1 hypothetical protein [Flavobacterium psychrophilum]EKT4553243.1 hypothetical protein [Flavobacterium psychrophilum]ELM3645104.1 hypothetical protein [Flavobacterium psychrophilum]ELM3651560.1 hypothetical protein [Flavobacterium psychrophilum]
MRNLFYLFICGQFLITSCNSKKEEFTLIGKWQLTKTISGNGGGKNYQSDVSNGRIFEFRNNGEILDKSGLIGKYQIDSTKTYLQISFPNSEVEYFNYYSEENNYNKITLNPVNSEHQLICDCGCLEIYKKIK